MVPIEEIAWVQSEEIAHQIRDKKDVDAVPAKSRNAESARCVVAKIIELRARAAVGCELSIKRPREFRIARCNAVPKRSAQGSLSMMEKFLHDSPAWCR